MTSQSSRLAALCDALIQAGSTPGASGVRWPAFMLRGRVRQELKRRGYELIGYKTARYTNGWYAIRAADASGRGTR